MNNKKRFKIISVIYAKDLLDAVKHADDAEMVDVELMDEINKPDTNEIGFSSKR